jgi:hypothetical protein
MISVGSCYFVVSPSSQKPIVKVSYYDFGLYCGLLPTFVSISTLAHFLPYSRRRLQHYAFSSRTCGILKL